MRKHLVTSTPKTLLVFYFFVSGLLLPGSVMNNCNAQVTDKNAQYKEYIKKGDAYLAVKNYAAAMYD